MVGLASVCFQSCDAKTDYQDNLNNSIWLINSIRVYQRPGYKPIPQQAPTTQNLTGSPGILGARYEPPIKDAAGPAADVRAGMVWAVLAGLGALALIV
jgi:hypothetical protein